jgi:hypothetical protein
MMAHVPAHKTAIPIVPRIRCRRVLICESRMQLTERCNQATPEFSREQVK